MTGILVGDAKWKRLQFGGEAKSGKKFGDVAGFLGEGARLRVLFLTGRKEMIVFFERGAAAGGVGNDGVEILAKENRQIVAGEAARDVADARVRGESAAAKLPIGHDDFATVSGKDADGRFVQLRKGDISDASSKESDASAARTGGGEGLTEAAEKKVIVDAREQTFAFGDPQELQDADAAGNGLQARALIQAKQAGGVREVKRTGEQNAENEIARDARAGVLDEFAVLDAGGAGGFAGAAVQAFVDVIDKGAGDGQLA